MVVHSPLPQPRGKIKRGIMYGILMSLMCALGVTGIWRGNPMISSAICGKPVGLARVHSTNGLRRAVLERRASLVEGGKYIRGRRDILSGKAMAPPREKTMMPKLKKRISKKDSGIKGGRFNLLLHNDEINKKDYVVEVLTSQVPGLSQDQALDIMEVAHTEGKAIVRECDEGEARKLCSRLRDNGLTSTVAPL
ncbi:hypothetical protein AAMO2058_000806600 [Amorphochlora amoebiformis]